MGEYTIKPFDLKNVPGISDKTNEYHHGKLYTGYVNKRNEVDKTLLELPAEDWANANQVYSKLRGLKADETFAVNGSILHEYYFGVMKGNGDPKGTKVYDAIVKKWGSWETFIAHFSGAGMVARGWAILCFDTSDSDLHIYTADAQNQGGVWGALPLLCMDTYEHAYWLDYGADRTSYIKAFLAQVNWQKVDEWYARALKLQTT